MTYDPVAETGGVPKPVKTHDYKVVNCSIHGGIEAAANYYAQLGWRVVGVIGGRRDKGYADQLVLERPIGISHPDD